MLVAGCLIGAQFADAKKKQKVNNNFVNLAKESSNIDSIRDLLDEGEDVNVRDSSKYTALMHAAKFGYDELLTMLVERKANVNAVQECGSGIERTAGPCEQACSHASALRDFR
jgi:ankyrin repeat protein